MAARGAGHAGLGPRPAIGGLLPTITRWFIRAAIVHLVAGLALGLIMVLPSLAEAGAAWRPVYVHLLVMGWATQMIFGVALWMFPRRRPLDLTTLDVTGWSCFVTLNLGLVVRALAEPALARGAMGSVSGTVAAAALQLVSVVLFTIQIWPRVVAR